MKKLISIIITAIMFFSISITAFAAEKNLIAVKPNIDLKQAVEIAKEKLNVKTEGMEFNNSYYEHDNNKSAWNLSWRNKKNNYEGIEIDVDAVTGDILRFSKWDYSKNDNSKIPKYTKEAALKAAEDFLLKLEPNKYKEVKFLNGSKFSNDSDLYSAYYTFAFSRQINGINFSQNGMTVNVNKNTLDISEYELSWDNNAKFPDKNNAISKDKAQDIYKNKLGLELSCQLINKNEGELVPMLVYSFKDKNGVIDALTGEVLENNNYEILKRYAMDEKFRSAGGGGTKEVLTPEETASLEKNSKLIKQDEAVQILKKYLPINEKYTLQSANLYTDRNNSNPTWFISYYFNSKEGYGSMRGEVDALTKEVLSFYIEGNEFYPKGENIKPSYSKVAAKAKADEFLKTICGEKFKLTSYDDNYNEDIDYGYIRNYDFHYTGKINGVVCPFDSIVVSVNAYTGEVMCYNLNWKDIKLPSKDKIISLEKANSIVFQKLGFDKEYIKYKNVKEKDSKEEIKLAYLFDSIPGAIDANSGELIDSMGKTIKEIKPIIFNDIKGSPSEENIKILSDLRIIDDETVNFNPYDYILQKDFIKYMVRSLEPYFVLTNEDSYDEYYKIAIDRKLISEKEKNINGNVSKEFAAKIAVRALNLGYTAELSNIFTTPYKDAGDLDAKLKGYVAIANELKIIPVKDGYLYPKNNITRAEAADIIVNYLKVNLTLND